MIQDVAFVLRGKIRRGVFMHLQQPKTPTDLSKLLHVHRPSISRTLHDLAERGLAVCLNPDDKFVRFYQLTTRGETILREVQRLMHT